MFPLIVPNPQVYKIAQMVGSGLAYLTYSNAITTTNMMRSIIANNKLSKTCLIATNMNQTPSIE